MKTSRDVLRERALGWIREASPEEILDVLPARYLSANGAAAPARKASGTIVPASRIIRKINHKVTPEERTVILDAFKLLGNKNGEGTTEKRMVLYGELSRKFRLTLRQIKGVVSGDTRKLSSQSSEVRV